MKLRHIDPKNMPPRIDVLYPFLLWLVLERFAAPAWLYGVLYTLLGIVYAAKFYLLFAGEKVDLLSKKAEG